MAGLRHLPALQRLGADVVALADTDSAALASLADAHRIERRHPTAEAMLDDSEVDCVGILVPPAAHADLAVAVLEAGKDVLVEKPLALTPADCERMVRAAESSERVAMVGHNLRFHRLVARARELIAAGAIGEPQAISTAMLGTSRDPDGATPTPEWLADSKLGGGAMTEVGVHQYDLWKFLCGGSVRRVVAEAVPGKEGRRATVAATLEGGVVAQALAAYGAVPACEVTVAGSGGWLELDLYAFDGLRLRGPADISGSPRTRLAGALAGLRMLPRGLAELRAGGAYVGSYAQEWRHFLDCVDRCEPTLSPLADGRDAALVAVAARRSLEEGAAVGVDQLRALADPSAAPPG